MTRFRVPPKRRVRMVSVSNQNCCKWFRFTEKVERHRSKHLPSHTARRSRRFETYETQFSQPRGWTTVQAELTKVNSVNNSNLPVLPPTEHVSKGKDKKHKHRVRSSPKVSLLKCSPPKTPPRRTSPRAGTSSPPNDVRATLVTQSATASSPESSSPRLQGSSTETAVMGSGGESWAIREFGHRRFQSRGKVTFRPFKVIQGHHWFWQQSKARKQLPISPS